jgi:dihydroxyacetone kinase
MTQFMNKRENIVTEAIDGVIMASGGRLARLDGFPHIRVVVRADWDKSRVALVSGGGSGHEPAHAGFVGPGMLTAAVCGDVFASPSVDAVLAGILAVTGPAGCLLIVKNYTGDRLNFGLAAERARAFGLKVSMVIVDDDIALPDLPQARGVAGTLFVHKIAGHLAEAGADLAAVTVAAERVIAGTKSIGMSLDTCTVPGSVKENRIAPGMAELGLGIHGEPGVELLPAMADVPHVALLNNLGGTSVLEMSVLAYELARSTLGARIKLMVGPAQMMTSLDMRGVSVSVYPLTAEDEAALQAHTPLAAWPGCHVMTAPQLLALPDGLTPIRPIPSAHPPTRAFLTKCCEIMIGMEYDLNALDAKSGDGDTGSTLAGAARALIGAMDHLPLADHTQLYRAIGLELSQTMGGSSGVLLAIFFAAAGDAASSGLTMSGALLAGLERMQEIGGARAGDRTMIDALQPALEALDQGLGAATVAARKGADYTATLKRPRRGGPLMSTRATLKGMSIRGRRLSLGCSRHSAAKAFCDALSPNPRRRLAPLRLRGYRLFRPLTPVLP